MAFNKNKSLITIRSVLLCRENLLFGMSDMLANRVSELVGGLLGLIPTKYQLNNISSSVGSKQ